ncbi:alkaline phosphatase D family protein [Chitinibacter bivalviorum]|uniref:Alkaline phosphatase D family protein n=1 Tax=Chitinibacter bivalviorum TaxID=2739434 RepID=A0A7H9BM20_9NEIS|nr:alkaline phosphatase D family protein [Chitinibacter bivalviorum]QLG89519.1 alkaline phosphatase D family protein [Chitinibacter bivalviorum]
MDRRQFIRLAGFMTASVASPLLITACGGSSDASSSTSGASTTPAPGKLFQFPQGIASGDPRADSVILWTRVLPVGIDPISSQSAAMDSSIVLQVFEGDPAALTGTAGVLQGKLVANVTLNASSEWDHSVRHKLSGLQSNTTYGYQFIAGGSRSMIGRFKTAPAATADVSQLKFAFLSCQDWSINHWGAFDLLAKDELDFIVHLGDYIYETVGEAFQTGQVESAHSALKLPDGPFKNGQSGARYANTLADYRALYKQYRSDPRLQQVHARFAMIAIWDDHEFSDDCWGDATTYDNGTYDAKTGGDNKHETTRRRSANQAWYEFMPADVVFDAKATGFQTVRLYRDFQFGKLLHLVMTDERLYRADHIIPEAAAGSSVGSRYLVPSNILAGAEAQKMAAGKAAGDELALVSILGKPQRDWWKTTLKSSPANWKVWGNEVSLLKMRLDARKLAGVPVAMQQDFVLNADQWDGFNAERSDLLNFIRSNSIKNVVAVTGDIHSFYAGVAHADYSQNTPALVDLVTAGISSDSFYHYFASSVRDPALASSQPLVFSSDAGAEQIAIQMLSIAIAQKAGVSNLNDSAAIKAAVGGAVAAGLVPAAAFLPTANLSKAEVNTFNDLLGGELGKTIAGLIANLAAKGLSVAAQTLYALVAKSIAEKMSISPTQVPAAQIVPFLNPFADQATGKGPINNPWIRYADTDAQGYAVVTVTPDALNCTFRKVNLLQNGQLPATVLSKETRLQVQSGVVDVKLV